ncbi:hypothetical protein HQ524_04395 [Candidatus Uhrbacteria bacterium]|nr:hypothetical protein [Candidatus Uhrbacteria bacterium]
MMFEDRNLHDTIKRAHAYHVANVDNAEMNRDKSMKDILTDRWELISHLLAAFFLLIAMSLALSFFESSVNVSNDTQTVPVTFSVASVANAMLGINTAHAREGYDGIVVSTEPSKISVSNGEAKAVRIQVKNTGSETWYREGANYISAYTYEPKYHVSPLRGPKWRSDHQVGTLMEKSVAPGQIGTVELFVFGPPGFEGELTEYFRLSAEYVSWIGGSVAVNVSVTSAVGAPLSAPAPADASNASADAQKGVPTSPEDTGYNGFLLMKSAKSVSVRANEEVSIRASFKNSGTKTWSAYELVPVVSALASVGDEVSYYHPSWTSNQIATSANGMTVAPGSVERIDLTFRAPNKSGIYTAAFQLVVDGTIIPDAVVELPVEVTSNAAQLLDAPKKIAPLTQTVYREGVQIEEPRVRVGIEILEAVAVFTANTDVTVVESEVGYERFVIPAGQVMEVNFNGSKYVFKSGDILHVADSFLRFEGKNEDTVFTISSRDDIRSWNKSLNDNTFRDTLEVRFNNVKDRTWLINELPIEKYLRGIDETSDYAPEEYHKTLYTSARTYATYAWETKTKYAGEHIDMRSSTYDQVYHGYGAETRRPNVVKAVEDTAGQTIQYDGETIIAAYFSRSDGRTRSWKSVWGREVPYAQSVSVPCEVGRVKWGHGVGLSAGGALCMADDGSTYDEILKYFYTGVELIKRW